MNFKKTTKTETEIKTTTTVKHEAVIEFDEMRVSPSNFFRLYGKTDFKLTMSPVPDDTGELFLNGQSVAIVRLWT